MMMEHFVPSQEYLINAAEGNLLWPISPELHFDSATAFPDDQFTAEFDPPPPPAARRSAFRSYARSDAARMMERSGTGGRNMHLLIVGMLRQIQRPEEHRGSGGGSGTGGGVETSRGFRHMMRERQRREKLSQSYADLYSIVASRSKSDKNSIVQSATEYVQELKGVKEALQKRNEELRGRILGGGHEGATKVRITMANPSSPVESLIGALRCLRGMDVKARAIRSDLSSSNFSAVVSIDTEQMAAGDVERAMEGALMEIEKKLRRDHLPGINAWS